MSENDKLRQLLRRYLELHPAFRLKPIGAPNSYGRMLQDAHIKLEDEARVAVKDSCT